MAKKNILEVEPHKIKPGVDGKIFLVHGVKKSGKTTFGAKCPSPLLLALEPGYGLIDGVRALDVGTWVEFKDIVKQLKTDEAKAAYKTIVIDTVSILWELAGKFIWIQKQTGDLDDYTMGLNQNKVAPEFSQAIREIAAEGYTVVMIAHSTKKDFTDEVGKKFTQSVTVDLPKRAKAFVTSLADLTIFVNVEPNTAGDNVPVMYLRSGLYDGLQVEDVGGRYSTLPVKAPFSYESLISIIGQAEDAMRLAGIELDGATNILQSKITADIVKPWNDLVVEVNNTLLKISEKANAGNTELSKETKRIIASYLGENNKITEANQSQQELVEAALEELKMLVAE